MQSETDRELQQQLSLESRSEGNEPLTELLERSYFLVQLEQVRARMALIVSHADVELADQCRPDIERLAFELWALRLPLILVPLSDDEMRSQHG